MSKIKRAHGLAAVRVEGGLLPPDFLREIAAQKAVHQSDAAYRVSRSLQLKDELGRYWHIARDLWKSFVQRRQRKDLDQQKITTEFLEAFLRDVLGYHDLKHTNGVMVEGRNFAVTHRGAGGQLTLALVSNQFDLDRAEFAFGEEGRRRSPFNLMQEYLNADDRAQWGIVSNGSIVRLLRDNPSLTRPAYIECDLELMLADEIYSDFTVMWLLLHDSRFRREGKQAGSQIIEQWRLQAHQTGERALAHLREGVAEAMRVLGSGFVAHPANEALRERIVSGKLTPQAYYEQLLRLVYRFLFLFTVEDRDLLFPPRVKSEKRRIYAEGYSLTMLRERVLRRGQDGQHSDLWQGLQIVFRGLAGDESVQDTLGLPGLDGLFASGQCSDLDEALVGNAALLKAVRSLAYFQTESGLARVNYRDMGTEELGSVYEGLLELHPQFQVETRPWSFGFVSDVSEMGTRGSERKSTGSYYTPASLVNELIKSALVPVMAKAVADHPEDPRKAILDLKVIDPACGSGHFLLEAARRMAAEIARLESDGSGMDEQVRRHALREVVQHCIYGVDKNPLAVELCRAALWIETIEPGKPLSFLDAHIQCGDSLIGLRDPSVLAEGIPMDAYKALTGDEPEAEKELKRRNKGSVFTLQLDLFQPTAADAAEDGEVDIEAMPEETVADLEAKRAQWVASRGRRKWMEAKDAADMYVAAFFLPKRMDCIDVVPVNQDLARLVHQQPARLGLGEVVRRVAVERRFLHWHLAFSQVMKRGGFDVVLGNPPWEVQQFNEVEFFSARMPSIAAMNGEQRKLAIRALEQKDRSMWFSYLEAKRELEAANLFARASGRFLLTARGKINSYALFAEHSSGVLTDHGRAGLVVPTGVATDDTLKEYFDDIVGSGRLVSLFDFRNKGFFPGAASAQGNRFCLLTLSGRTGTVKQPRFAFRLEAIDHLTDSERQFSLSPEDIALLNPNTRTCPVFRSKEDAELTKGLYLRVPILVDESKPEGNPWNVVSRQGLFNMTSDSAAFRTSNQLQAAGAVRLGVEWIASDGARWVPLYEAKMMHQYDHRYGDYSLVTVSEGKEVRQLPQAPEDTLRDIQYEPTPRYWVPSTAVDARTLARNWSNRWLMGWRDITSALDEHTVIASVVPKCGVGDKLLLLFPGVPDQRLNAALLANLNTITLDYLARQKLGGTSLKYYVIKQLPVLPPTTYSGADLGYIVPRVVELSFTSEILRPFASDMGYDGPPFPWNPGRRALLRAELDAYFAKLYGLTRDQLRYILDPIDVFGTDYPSETFRVLKENEQKEFGEYRTRRLILEAWDRLFGAN